MQINNYSDVNNGARFERNLREKFARCTDSVAPPADTWQRILEKVKQAMEAGEWPDDLDEEEYHPRGERGILLKSTKVIWSRNGNTQN
ncbi:MAG: hypothetical protein JXB38_16390 [Anaerolineales bacterium]|nr:hypothetical protein [Anaerolineales bacterium]